MFLVRSWTPLMSAEKWTVDDGKFEAWLWDVVSPGALREPVVWEGGSVDIAIGEVNLLELCGKCFLRILRWIESDKCPWEQDRRYMCFHFKASKSW